MYHVGRCIIYSVLNSEGPLLDVLDTKLIFLSFTYVDDMTCQTTATMTIIMRTTRITAKTPPPAPIPMMVPCGSPSEDPV